MKLYNRLSPAAALAFTAEIDRVRKVMSYFSYIYIVVFVFALLWATYVSFIKLKIQKNS